MWEAVPEEREERHEGEKRERPGKCTEDRAISVGKWGSTCGESQRSLPRNCIPPGGEPFPGHQQFLPGSLGSLSLKGKGTFLSSHAFISSHNCRQSWELSVQRKLVGVGGGG